MQRREGSTLTFKVYHKTSPLEEKALSVLSKVLIISATVA